ncbi:MAG: MFS transporter [Proteobacteria bacterium]|nr:MFS transporter [Pseudomonadota bacterium]
METSTANASLLTGAMKRNLFTLTCCQAIGQAGNVMMLSVTALAVITFFPMRELATLPTTMQHVGVMVGVFPASALMMRLGRSIGFRVGSLFGMAGATCCALGLLYANFVLMCVGGLLLGYAVANLQLYRFAAVELVPFTWRAKAISWVTTGGVAAGILGPILARTTFDALLPLYLGTYVSMIVIHVVVFFLMGFVKFPPLHKAEAAEGPARPLWQIARQPRYAAAVVAGVSSWATMMFLMSSSPLAIVGCGLPPTEPPVTIFMHVMGMYAPSFFTGGLITRFGTVRIMALGSLILMAGVIVAMLGVTAWNFRVSLMLNGVGWNFLFIGATTLLTTCYRPAERGKAQALNDFLIFGTTATASFLAGFVQERVGWFVLNEGAIVLVLVSLLAVVWLGLQRRPALAPA